MRRPDQLVGINPSSVRLHVPDALVGVRNSRAHPKPPQLVGMPGNDARGGSGGSAIGRVYVASGSSQYSPGNGLGYSYAALTDGSYMTGWATNSALGEWIMADFGQLVFANRVGIGGLLPGAPGGWGYTYANGVAMECDIGNGAWTALGTTVVSADSTTFQQNFSGFPAMTTFQRFRLRSTAATYAAVAEIVFT